MGVGEGDGGGEPGRLRGTKLFSRNDMKKNLLAERG